MSTIAPSEKFTGISIPYRRLKDDEIKDLTEKTKKGCLKSREVLILNNVRLVAKIAREYQGLGVDLEDLVTEGTIGLIQSLSKYDPERSRLSTYASWWIHQRIKRALCNQSRTIRVPVHMMEKVAHMRRANDLIEQELGRKATDVEIIERTGLSESTILKCREADRVTVSMNGKARNWEESGTEELGDLIQDGEEGPDAKCVKAGELQCLAAALDILEPREQEIIIRRFGLNGNEPETLVTIGESFNVTRERIRQVECKAVKKLRAELQRRAEIKIKDSAPANLSDIIYAKKAGKDKPQPPKWSGIIWPDESAKKPKSEQTCLALGV